MSTNVQLGAAYCDQQDMMAKYPAPFNVPTPRKGMMLAYEQNMRPDMLIRFRQMLADIRHEISLAGGRLFTDEDIVNTSVGEMFSTFARNNIDVTMEYDGI